MVEQATFTLKYIQKKRKNVQFYQKKNNICTLLRRKLRLIFQVKLMVAILDTFFCNKNPRIDLKFDKRLALVIFGY